jgi:hypothetical protein
MDILKVIEKEGLLNVATPKMNKVGKPEWYTSAQKYADVNRTACQTSEDFLRLGAEVVLLLLGEELIDTSKINMKVVLQAIKNTFATLPREDVVTKTGKTVNVIKGVYSRSNFRSTAEGVDYKGVYGVATILLHNFDLAEQLRTEYKKLLAGSVVKPSTVSPALKSELKKLAK